MSLQKGLVGHWTMDSRDTDNGVIRDRSGFENHGTINGVSFNTPGKLGEAGAFNGTNDFIEIEKLSGTDISGASGNTTISYWFRTENVSDRGEIVSRYQPGRGISNSVRDGVHTTVTGDSGGNNNITIAVDSGEWYHHVLTYNNSTNDNVVYINGSQYGSFTQNFNTSTEDGFYIGDSSFDNNFHFDGLIDDVRIYKRALSDEEINNLYQQRNVQQTSSRGFPVASGNLVARYPFRDGSARDDARNANYADPTAYDGVVTGATYHSNKGPNGNGAFVFDGDDKITVDPINNLPTNEFTVSMWHNKDSDSSAVCFWHMPDSSGNNTNSLFTDSDEYNYIRNGSSFQPSTSISTNSWEHILISGNGSTATIYRNGSSIGNTSYNSFNFEGVFYIGVDVDGSPRGGFSEFFRGQIADVRIYDKGLSSSKVNQLYQNTRPQISASGGSTITTETINGEQYRIHAFENVGTSTFEVSDAQANATADVLVVGGGGAGGQDNGAGGGAGGLVYNNGVSVSQNSYSIQVGTGGDNKRSQAEPNGDLREIGGSGGDSSAFSLTAKGGGGGGCGNTTTPGSDGGSGGGEDGEQNDGFGSGSQPGTNSGVVFDLGNDGGLGGPSSGAGGGGGGATQNGDSGGSNSDAGNGGDGKDMSQFFGTSFGENGIFAGGGAGGVANDAGIPDSNHGNGGLGGGGNHGKSTEYEGEDGQQNTGGGGGGGAYDGSNQQRAGNGGSGIVLIRYKL